MTLVHVRLDRLRGEDLDHAGALLGVSRTRSSLSARYVSGPLEADADYRERVRHAADKEAECERRVAAASGEERDKLLEDLDSLRAVKASLGEQLREARRLRADDLAAAVRATAAAEQALAAAAEATAQRDALHEHAKVLRGELCEARNKVARLETAVHFRTVSPADGAHLRAENDRLKGVLDRVRISVAKAIGHDVGDAGLTAEIDRVRDQLRTARGEIADANKALDLQCADPGPTIAKRITSTYEIVRADLARHKEHDSRNVGGFLLAVTRALGMPTSTHEGEEIGAPRVDIITTAAKLRKQDNLRDEAYERAATEHRRRMDWLRGALKIASIAPWDAIASAVARVVHERDEAVADRAKTDEATAQVIAHNVRLTTEAALLVAGAAAVVAERDALKAERASSAVTEIEGRTARAIAAYVDRTWVNWTIVDTIAAAILRGEWRK